jgi:copper homeostasis protein
MPAKSILEVCAFHIDSCIIAERAGAARVELCDNPIEGGTTPSYGTLKRARESISIPLYPILRPRSGNYFYSDEEFAILKADIELCKQLGCDGISAGPMGVTCNRVFDCAPDPFKALEDVILCGCERILTSGQKRAAPDAGALLGRLVEQAGSRITVMPGAGVNSSNIAKLKRESGAREFHSSARIVAPNPVTYVNPAVSDYGNVYIADETEVRAMVEALRHEEAGHPA